ncbi:isoprenylcysteine carboxyl methyltransferase family protein [Calidithermus timidus]|uniref:isoprenylcysteine carboxyl methyltransferase family protein n=1 Tax=Calidithermus timidus TaxID=307124 RepID=UPI0009FC8FCF|nr:isoprenylcysteine carboxylmethyltransferase family protein [Calidithermus timidus]
MLTLVLFAVGVVLIQRLLELGLAYRNLHWALERGGGEYGQEHYPYFFLLHGAWLLGVLFEGGTRQNLSPLWPLWLLLFLAAQYLRYWSIYTLGRYWNTRIVLMPGAPAIETGPFRYLRHPNYVAVALELLTLPLIFNAWVTAVLATLFNAILLLGVRIPLEERLMEQNRRYKSSANPTLHDLSRPFPGSALADRLLIGLYRTPLPGLVHHAVTSVRRLIEASIKAFTQRRAPKPQPADTPPPPAPNPVAPVATAKAPLSAPAPAPRLQQPRQPTTDPDSLWLQGLLEHHHRLVKQALRELRPITAGLELTEALAQGLLPRMGHAGNIEYVIKDNVARALVQGYFIQWDIRTGGLIPGAEAQTLWYMTRDHQEQFGDSSELKVLEELIQRLRKAGKLETLLIQARTRAGLYGSGLRG